MKLALPKFLDHHPTYNGNGGYTVTNEEPEIFNEILGKIKVNRAACIASGGEILVSVIMPRADEVVAVDHAYTSLFVAYLKTILLQSGRTKEFIRALREEDYDRIAEQFKACAVHLPEALKKSRGSNTISKYDLTYIRKEWCHPAARITRLPNKRVSNTTFVHGDLRDIPKLFGTFDLFYASNAMEHSGRDHKSPTLSNFAELLNSGGLLLYTAQYNTGRPDPAVWETIKIMTGIRSSWKYCVMRKIV